MGSVINQHYAPPFSFSDNNDPNTPGANNDSGSLITKGFTLQVLTDATDNFSPECLVDVGSFGKVYRGNLRETGEV